jgi:transcriptional regulator with XRE-family HTH domain
MNEIKTRKKIPPTKAAIEIAKRLKEKREEHRYSLQEVADNVGISKVTLHRYENLDITNIPSDKIEILAKIYKTTPSYLMGWEDENENYRVINSSGDVKLDYGEFTKQSKRFFNDDNISNEDKELFFKSLQEIFLDSILRKSTGRKNRSAEF